MVDVVDRATRSRMMSGIRSRDTSPERLVRSALHQRGFRFGCRSGVLPGRPDVVLPRYRTVIFVHGCFWHGHGCRLFRWPATNRRFWRIKLAGNAQRDQRIARQLLRDGWRVITIWECTLRNRPDSQRDRIFDRVARWIRRQDPKGRQLTIGRATRPAI